MRELREFCKRNACGRYGKNYTCPPLVGEADMLIAKAQSFPTAVILQNIYLLEDSYDYGGMTDGLRKHNEMTLAAARRACAEYGRDNMLALAAGGCFLCEVCGAVYNTPCPRREDALSSMEAYCINVSRIEDVTGMKYINGENTVTYFSCLLLPEA